MSENSNVYSFVAESDGAAVYNFYDNAQHKNIHLRAKEKYFEVAARELVTAMKDNSGAIKAATVAWPQGHNRYIESGSLRNIGPSGMGVMEVMVALQCLDAFMRFPPEVQVVCDVHQDNPSVHGRYQKPPLNFKPWHVTEDFKKTKGATINPASEAAQRPLYYFQCGVENLPEMAGFILKMEAEGELVAKDGRKISVRFDEHPLFRDHHKALERLAQANFSADVSKGWQEVGKAFKVPAYPAP